MLNKTKFYEKWDVCQASTFGSPGANFGILLTPRLPLMQALSDIHKALNI